MDEQNFTPDFSPEHREAVLAMVSGQASASNPAMADYYAQNGKADWRDSSIPLENRLADFLQVNRQAGRSWEDTQQSLQQNPAFQHLGTDQHAILRREFGRLGQAQQLEQHRASLAGAEERGGLGWFARRADVFGMASFLNNRAYQKAREKFERGEASDGDLSIMAQWERLQQLQQQEGVSEGLTRAAIRLPTMLAEMYVGGRALGAVGSWTQRGLAAVGVTSAARAASSLPSLTSSAGLRTLLTAGGAKQYAAELPGYLGRLAAQTAAMPSFYLPEASQRAAVGEGEFWSPQNLAPAFGLGMMNMAVLGSMGHIAEGIEGASLGAFLKRTAARAGLGLGEQQAVDVIASAAGLSTGYGILGDAFRGDWGHVWQRLAVEGATFAAFGALHEYQHGAPKPLTELSRAGQALRETGLSRDAAAMRISQIHDALVPAVPTMNREQGRAFMETLIQGDGKAETAMRRYGMSLIEQLPEQLPQQPQAQQPAQPLQPQNFLAAPEKKLWYDRGLTDFTKNAQGEPVHVGVMSGEPYAIIPRTSPDGKKVSISVRGPDGKTVPDTYFALSQQADGTWSGHVKSLGKPGEGLAQAMYDYANRFIAGGKLTESAEQSEAGKGRWEKNQEAKRADLKTAIDELTKRWPTSGEIAPKEEVFAAAKEALEEALGQGGEVGLGKADEIIETLNRWREDHAAIDDARAIGKRFGLSETSIRRSIEERLQEAAQQSEALDAAQATDVGRGTAASGEPGAGRPGVQPGTTPETAAAPRGAAARGELSDREIGENLAQQFIAQAGPNFLLAPSRPPAPVGKAPNVPSASEKQAAVAQAIATPLADQFTAGMALKNQTLGEMHRRNAIAEKELEAARKAFDANVVNLPDATVVKDRFLNVMDAVQKGQIATFPEDMRPALEALRKGADEGEKLLRERDMLHSFVENYFPQIYKEYNDALAQGIRRPWGGRQGFLEHRSIPDYRTAVEQHGLTPVSWNPAEILMLNLREIHKAVMRHDLEKRAEAMGARVYARLGAELPGEPGTYRRLKEANEAVFAPPETQTKVYVDEKQMRGLEEFAKDYGIDVQRVQSGAPGMHEPNRITMRFGTTEENFAHEIGHEIDRRNNLQTWLGTPVIAGELARLADLRAEGRVSPEYKAYLHAPAEQIANLITGYFHAPELTKTIAPVSYARLDQFLNADPQLKKFADIKPSLVLGEREQMLKIAGPQLVGHYYYLKPFADIIDNYLSPGLRSNKLYHLAREFSDGLNQAQLGGTFFHAGFEGIEGMASAIALGVQEASRGQLVKGAARALVSPVSIVKNLIEGKKGISEYMKPGSTDAETAKIVDALVSAGYRPYQDEFASHFSRLKETWKTLGEAEGLGKVGPAAKALWHGIGSALEVFSYPVMNVMVPRMKTGVAMDMVRSWMDTHQGASFAEKQAAVSKIWDSTENRLGQFTYDRTNLSRMQRDILHLSIRSVGWNLGTIRELLGGVYDIPTSIKGVLKGEGVTERTAYVVGMTLATAAMGYLVSTLYGQVPQTFKDYMFPRTGRTRQDGSEDRVSLPSYMRDVFSVLNRADEGPQRIMTNLWTMAKHKVNPGLAIAAEMLSNEDFYGRAIWNYNDPWMRQAEDMGLHLMTSATPFGVRGLQQQLETGATDPTALAGPFVGVTPSPAYITRTAEQQRQQEERRRYRASPQEARRQQERRQIQRSQDTTADRLRRALGL